MSAVTVPGGLPQHDLARVLSQVVECAPNGVVPTRSDGSILLVNAELERMFGYTRAQLLEGPIERLVPERFREGHAALRSELAEDGRPRAMGTGRELIGLRAVAQQAPGRIPRRPHRDRFRGRRAGHDVPRVLAEVSMEIEQ